MTYQALYRVWRPQNFEDVVGQEHITKTLQNALLHEKFSHAYLFSGPRGTGKTSAAKIISKAINCEKAPVAEPCNECSSCIGITNGSINDVIEIDAASNNGVDEIRDIRDKVKYAPSSVQYKVYIIDEVHMLSIGAFNALLKTLEEPPKHVIFILATTEPHKIPLTIISRCQRFDFRRIPVEAMMARMKKIIDSQHIEVEEKALKLVAQSAEGGMRDALSILDQAISFSDQAVTEEDVLTITGAVSQNLLAETVDVLIERDAVTALKTLDQLLQQGKDPRKYLEDLIFYFRDMLLYQSAPDLEEVFERVSLDQRFQQLSDKITTDQIYEIIDILNKSQQEMKFTNHPKVFLEMALVKICRISSNNAVGGQSLDFQELHSKINLLEKELTKLKEQGIQVKSEQTQSSPAAKRSMKPPNRGLKIQTGRIKEMLKQASKQELQVLQSRWADIMEFIKKEKISAHATLIESEPVASSNHAFILSFKYEIHCKMAGENRDIIENAITMVLGKKLDMLELPESEWNNIKQDFIRSQRQADGEEEENEDPVVAEAKKLFGDQIVEVKE